LPDVPGRPVRDGASLAALSVNDTEFVYLLKGSGTREFARFNLMRGNWEILEDAPPGASGHSYKAGSSLAAYPDGDVYVLKGGVNEFFAYDAVNRVWTTKAMLPLIGQSGIPRKAGVGAGLARWSRTVYCLKGGNSTELWAYDCADDLWQQGLDFRGGSPVRAGGALACAWYANALYALRGGSSDFRLYPLPISGFVAGARRTGPGIQRQSAVRSSQLALSVSPNPFSGVTRVSCNLPVAGNVSLRLYDIAGKLVQTLDRTFARAGVSDFEFRISSLPAGIYLLRLETTAGSTTQKLIVE